MNWWALILPFKKNENEKKNLNQTMTNFADDTHKSCDLKIYARMNI